MPRGTIQNRAAFLDNIAKKIGGGRETDEPVSPVWKHQPQLQVNQHLAQDELVGILKDICGRIHTAVFQTDADSLPEVLTDTVKTHGGGPIVTSDDPHFLGFGLGLFLERDDVHIWNPSRGQENISFAKKANIGVTFSDVTLAESGTVVLFSDKDRGRSVSLLPKTYIAIIPKSTIVPRMTQASQMIHEKIEAGQKVSSCVSFVTGPSNSADIELKSVIGVHGPVQVTYIIVSDR